MAGTVSPWPLSPSRRAVSCAHRECWEMFVEWVLGDCFHCFLVAWQQAFQWVWFGKAWDLQMEVGANTMWLPLWKPFKVKYVSLYLCLPMLVNSHGPWYIKKTKHNKKQTLCSKKLIMKAFLGVSFSVLLCNWLLFGNLGRGLQNSTWKKGSYSLWLREISRSSSARVSSSPFLSWSSSNKLKASGVF